MVRILEPKLVFEDVVDGDFILQKLERAARTCYQSEGLIGPGSATKLLKKVLGLQHESVIEHVVITVRWICNRGVSHELVRHRIGSYSQESTRFCDYSNDKHGAGIGVIAPFYRKPLPGHNWACDCGAPECRRAARFLRGMEFAQSIYLEDLEDDGTPQESRGFLPNDLKTDIVSTFNLREWRWVFLKRVPKAAHPQMRQLSVPLLRAFQTLVPVLYDDLDLVGEDTYRGKPIPWAEVDLQTARHHEVAYLIGKARELCTRLDGPQPPAELLEQLTATTGAPGELARVALRLLLHAGRMKVAADMPPVQ
jgi:thymidylate synthase (FAD)